MWPVFFQIGGVSLYSFGLMVSLAFLCGGQVFIRRLKADKISENEALWLLVLILLGGVIGARLCYALFFPAMFWKDPWGVLLGSGGLVWYGGVVGSLMVLASAAAYKHWPWRMLLDSLALGAVLGQSIGRLGCFLSGCCYGAPTTLPWAVVYPLGHQTHPDLVHVQHVHPSPLYESIGMLGLFLTVNTLFGKPDKVSTPGQIAGWCFVGYGLVRFCVEATRGDRLLWIPGIDISASQWISMAMILSGVALCCKIGMKSRA